MLSGHRATALFVFAGLFAATQAGQADARSSAAVAAGQDASILSSAVDAAKLRAHSAAARSTSASRKLLQGPGFTEAQMEPLIAAISEFMEENPGKPLDVPAIIALVESSPPPPPAWPYRRSLMGVQDAS